MRLKHFLRLVCALALLSSLLASNGEVLFLRFCHYTNENRTTLPMLAAETGTNRIAVVQLVNISAFPISVLTHQTPRIELKTSTGWAVVRNYNDYLLSGPIQQLREGAGLRFQVLLPPGTNSWRCSVLVTGVTTSLFQELGVEPNDFRVYSSEILR